MPTNAPANTQLINLSQVDLLPDSRQHDPVKLETLAQDMQAQGQLQEIVVTPVQCKQETVGSQGGTVNCELLTVNPRYQVIAGVGRTLAAQKLGWTQIRASIRENVSEFDKARITFAENEDREDADAFYQAEQIQKMLDAKKCTQEALAQELGTSKATISLYIAIHGFSAPFQEKFRRLNFGVLSQIARLNEAKSQNGLGKKCLKNDLSVRQVKAIVDRLLCHSKEAKKPAAEMPDPLAGEWPEALMKMMGSQTWLWTVSYGMQPLPGLPAPVPGWKFVVANQTPAAREALAEWFREMGEVLNPTSSPAVVSGGAKLRVNMDPPLRAAEDDVLRAKPSQIKNARLPQNAAEEAELAQCAEQGPGAVYAWFYGPDSFLAKTTAGQSWNDLGAATPTEGVQRLLASLKKLQPSTR